MKNVFRNKGVEHSSAKLFCNVHFSRRAKRNGDMTHCSTVGVADVSPFKTLVPIEATIMLNLFYTELA